MDNAIGWLLDVTVEQNSEIVWLKTTDGKILRLIEKYHPNFYILPKDEIAGTELFHILYQQRKIRVGWRNSMQLQEVQIKISRAIDYLMTLHKNDKGIINTDEDIK